jgi:L-arabinose isomerase
MLLNQQFVHGEVRVDLIGDKGHFCHLFHYDGIMNCFVRILSPGERSVIFHQYAGNMSRVEFTETLDNDGTGLFFILAFHLRFGHITRTRYIPAEVIGMGGTYVAVTDGDKVEAEIRLGYHVDNAPIATLVPYVEAVTDDEIDALVSEYAQIYDFADDCRKGAEKHQFVRDAAAQEIGLRRFLQDKGAKAFTTSFNELEGMKQLMGFASQRLMAEGYGFGAEGDWKTAALVRTMWVMGQGLPGGQSFLEDYTLNFDGENSTILQSHMLEINPDITGTKPRIEVHFLGIGDARTCARLVFQAHEGKGVAATIVDMGNRFRMIVNEVEVVKPQALPKLPVACALWKPMPNLEVGAGAWILAGGTHHTSFSFSVTTEMLEDYAEIAGIELVTIDKDTTINNFKFELKVNEVYYLLNKALQ